MENNIIYDKQLRRSFVEGCAKFQPIANTVHSDLFHQIHGRQTIHPKSRHCFPTISFYYRDKKASNDSHSLQFAERMIMLSIQQNDIKRTHVHTHTKHHGSKESCFTGAFHGCCAIRANGLPLRCMKEESVALRLIEVM